MDTQILRQKFSKAAQDYDRYANIQKKAGECLLRRTEEDCVLPIRIIDIGCGTGSLLKSLAQRYSQAQLSGLDISWNMLTQVRRKLGGKQLIQADAQNLAFKDNICDLVVSNLTFQWMRDVQSVFKQVLRIISPGGRFYFNTFGPHTLKELKILFPLLDKQLKLMGQAELEEMLKDTGFSEVASSVSLEKENYPDLICLIKWLKNIGGNYTGYIPTKSLAMRSVFKETQELYKRYFCNEKGIYATFEVITVAARKN